MVSGPGVESTALMKYMEKKETTLEKFKNFAEVIKEHVKTRTDLDFFERNLLADIEKSWYEILIFY